MQNSSRDRSPSKEKFICTPACYFNLLSKLCQKYNNIFENIDAIVAIENGGVIPASDISNIYKKPLFCIGKDYRKPALTQNEKTIAIIDDVVDTGKEMKRVEKIIQAMDKNYYIFALIEKPWNPYMAASFHYIYAAECIQAWTIFPWENEEI